MDPASRLAIQEGVDLQKAVKQAVLQSWRATLSLAKLLGTAQCGAAGNTCAFLLEQRAIAPLGNRLPVAKRGFLQEALQCVP